MSLKVRESKNNNRKLFTAYYLQAESRGGDTRIVQGVYPSNVLYMDNIRVNKSWSLNDLAT